MLGKVRRKAKGVWRGMEVGLYRRPGMWEERNIWPCGAIFRVEGVH